jgi:tRNA 2-thiouridine synthesizing protein A
MSDPVSIDVRGLSCPQPVMQARNAIKAGSFPIYVLVDTVTARENVRRMAEHAGLRVKVEASGEDFVVTIER